MNYGNSTNVMTVPSVAPPSSAVDSQFRAGEELLAGLHNRIDALTSRLSSVLRPLPPQAVSGQSSAASKTDIGSPLCEALRARNLAVQSAIDKLNATIDALDL